MMFYYYNYNKVILVEINIIKFVHIILFKGFRLLNNLQRTQQNMNLDSNNLT